MPRLSGEARGALTKGERTGRTHTPRLVREERESAVRPPSCCVTMGLPASRRRSSLFACIMAGSWRREGGRSHDARR